MIFVCLFQGAYGTYSIIDVMSVGEFGTAPAMKNITISAVKYMSIATKWDTSKVISSLKSVQVMFCCQVGCEQNLGFSGLFGHWHRG